MSEHDTRVMKPPIEKLPRLHIFLQKARAFIKEVPIEDPEWEENRECALHSLDSAIAITTPVLELHDPCERQRIRIFVERHLVKLEEFQPELTKPEE